MSSLSSVREVKIVGTFKISRLSTTTLIQLLRRELGVMYVQPLSRLRVRTDSGGIGGGCRIFTIRSVTKQGRAQGAQGGNFIFRGVVFSVLTNSLVAVVVTARPGERSCVEELPTSCYPYPRITAKLCSPSHSEESLYQLGGQMVSFNWQRHPCNSVSRSSRDFF